MNVTSLLAIALGAILTNNFILVKFLGICPFMGVSKKTDTALGMGVAVTFVMALASMVTWAVDHYILTPLDLGYMQTAAFILIIAAIVQVVEMFLKKSVPTLYQALGIYLPLITTNCRRTGRGASEHPGALQFPGVSGLWLHRGLGFTLAIVLFSSVRQRVEEAECPGELPGISHCSDFGGPFGSGIYGFSGLRIF